MGTGEILEDPPETGIHGSADLLPTDRYPIARYWFRFEMDDDLRLPDYSGSLLRGQFGAALRRTACMTGAPQCDGCSLLRTCPFPAIFDTPAPEFHRLQRFTEVPNPYVMEPPAIGTRLVSSGTLLEFSVVLVGRAVQQLPLVAYALQRALEHGLGKERARGRLLDIGIERGDNIQSVWDAVQGRVEPHEAIVVVPRWAHIEEVTLVLETPLRLQHQGKPLRPESLTPRPLVTALMRRLSLLLEVHGDMPALLSDEAARALSGAADKLTDARRLQWHDWKRFSSRQQAEMTLGGVLGEWTLRGDLQSVLPFLWLGQWVHAGKNATMGLGRYTLRYGDGVVPESNLQPG